MCKSAILKGASARSYTTQPVMKIDASSALRAGLVAISVPLADANIYPDCTNGPLAKSVVCDPKAPPPDRAAALVKAMNISEKLVNLVESVTSREHTV